MSSPETPEAPTLAEIEQALRHAEVTDESGYIYSDDAERMCRLLRRLAYCLRSGEYAILSQADRIQAIAKANNSGSASERGYPSQEYEDEARRLLQLETKP